MKFDLIVIDKISHDQNNNCFLKNTLLSIFFHINVLKDESHGELIKGNLDEHSEKEF